MSKSRKPARVTKVEKWEQLVKQVEALSMAIRLNQMMVQNMGRAFDGVRENTVQNTSVLNDFQYRLLALQQLSGTDSQKLQEIADQLKLADFDNEVIRKDAEEQAIVADIVESDNDVVIITSTTPDVSPSQGILRSRIKIADMNQPELMASLHGKKVGDTVEAKLNETRHVIEILGVRRLPVTEVSVEEKAS